MGDGGTRDRLLVAATKLFAERGYRGVSIRDVAGEAEVNVAGVNYYFGTKEALWQEAYATVTSEVVVMVQKAIDPGAPAVDNVTKMIGQVFDGLSEDERALRMSMWASLTANDQLVQTARLLRPLLQAFRAVLGDQSVGRSDIELDLCAVYSILVQTLMWKGVHRELLGHEVSDDEFFARLRAYVIDTSLELLGLREAEAS